MNSPYNIKSINGQVRYISTIDNVEQMEKDEEANTQRTIDMNNKNELSQLERDIELSSSGIAGQKINYINDKLMKKNMVGYGRAKPALEKKKTNWSISSKFI